MQSPLKYFILAFLLLAVALRVIPAFACGVWFDEIFTIKLTSYDWSQMNRLIGQDVHPPFYYWFVHGFVLLGRWVGGPLMTVGWLRASSYAPNLVLCILLWVWAHRSWGREAGLVALALAAVSPRLCYYSVELRNYSMALALIVGSTMALLKALERPTPVRCILYVVCTLGALYVHYLVFVIYAGQILWTLTALRLRRKSLSTSEVWRILLMHGVVLLLLIPELSVMTDKYKIYYAPVMEVLRHVVLPWELFNTLFYHYPAGCVTGQYYNSPYGYLTQTVFFVFTLLLLADIFRAREGRRRAIFSSAPFAFSVFILIFYLGGTFAVTIAGWGDLFSGFRTSTLTVPFYIMVMVGLFQMLSTVRRRRVAAGFFIAATLCCAIFAMTERWRLFDDFGPLRDRLIAEGKMTPGDDRMPLYLDDAMLQPWLRDASRVLRIQSLEDLIDSNDVGEEPRLLISHPAPSVRLRSPDDEFALGFIRQWTASHGNKTQKIGLIETFELPADQVQAFGEQFRTQAQRH